MSAMMNFTDDAFTDYENYKENYGHVLTFSILPESFGVNRPSIDYGLFGQFDWSLVFALNTD